MVPAGVYLAARLFRYLPCLAWVLAIIGGFTLVLAAAFAMRLTT